MRRRKMTRCVRYFMWMLAGCVAFLRPLRADEFTYHDETGATVRIAARLVANERGVFVLELDDGEYRLVPEQAVVSRKVEDGPAPVTPAELLARWEKRFGAEKFRGYRQDSFVLGLVLAEPLPKGGDARATAALKKATAYMHNVEVAFGAFVKDLQIPVQPPRHPLLLLIFETDELFEKYARETIQGPALSLANISGFYSGMTNILAIRMSECFTFEVPLHEAIHQQVYNRHMFQRLAPIPHWFDEGIATGFEGNNGRISAGPTKITARYAQQALAARVLTWQQVLTNDKVFAGDVLVGEAYGYAWGLHWLLVTKYRGQYAKYVRMLARKTPLGPDSPELRLREFKEHFGDDLAKLENEFRETLAVGIKRQKIALSPQKAPGFLQIQQGLANLELKAVRRLDRGGLLEVQGKLQNTSPLRSMSYLVTLRTEGGLFEQWVLPNVQVQQVVPLGLKAVSKGTPNATGLPSNTFHVKVRSAPAGSTLAERWLSGELPLPVEQP